MKNTYRIYTQTSRFFFGFIRLILALVVFSNLARAAQHDVTNTNNSGPGSLRQAIIDVNNDIDTTKIIAFSIQGSGVRVINLTSPLPTIIAKRANCGSDHTIFIDATTMPGYAGAPLIEINGVNAGASAVNGLTIEYGIVYVRGLAINRFSGWGIHLKHKKPATDPFCPGIPTLNTTLNLTGSRIGTDAQGLQGHGNDLGGVFIQATTTASVGGVTANERNVISGNYGDGIQALSTGIYINNNLIGTNAFGTAAIANTGNGIKLVGSGATIGYPNPNGIRNVISGNGGNGIHVDGASATIVNNRIGTNESGTADLGNNANGIFLENPTWSTTYIGGSQANAGNVISGNNQNGILDNASETEIQGNYIGVNAAGTAAIGNTQHGVHLTGLTTKLGGTQSGEGNTISGNGGDGVKTNLGYYLSYSVIAGNRIGVNSSAIAAIPNGGSGITAAVTAGNSFIALTIEKNIISKNNSHGINLTDGANEVWIEGNYIGTNPLYADLGNTGSGIYAFGNAKDCDIRTNAIAYNDGDGIYLQPAFGGAVAENINMSKNSIYSNSGLGIDLGPTDGVTPNDSGDSDTGPNTLQNFPVLQTATTTTVSGTLNSTPNSDFKVHFYNTNICDASGYGEGRYYLGEVTTTTNAQGNATFTITNLNVAAGEVVTATATRTDGYGGHGTSEFSQCKTVIQTQPGNFAFGAATFTTNEGNGNLILAVNRLSGSDGTVTVNYATANGTAIAGQDYTATSGTLTFTNGQTVKNITIPIINDPNDEPNQDFSIALSSPTGGANLTNPSSAVVTIVDNDNPPTVSINDVSVLEGNENLTAFTFDISLSNASAFATSVAWATANGTANATSDYQTANGTVNFAAGETTKQITVQVIGELLVEINETFNVNLSSPTMATVGDGQGIGTILDDDNPGKLSFSLAPYSGTEGNSVTVTVSRTNGTAGTISVDYATGGGTATPLADYTPISGSLIFTSGETIKTFTVNLIDDQAAEPTENVNVVLSNPVGGASLGAPAIAAINILDNDSGTLHSIGGEILKPDNSPLVGATINLTGAQTAMTTTDAQGKFLFSNLAPNGNYAVAPQVIGFTFNPINRQYNSLSANIRNANFTATPAPSRQLRVVGGNAAPGQNVTATVELVAQGDENSVGFSLNFDHTVLINPTVVLGADALAANLIVNNSQAGAGKLGILLAMPAGQALAAGTKSLITVTFNTMPTNLYNSPVTFGNAPIGSQIVNSNADSLTTNYLDGAVTFAQGWEADVTPRPAGKNNGSITVTDFTQVGRFVAGLDTTNPQYNEFQRADCAPRISLGNGALDVADFTQAGRYAAAIDAVTSTGGQMAPRLLEFNNKGRLTVESLALLRDGNSNWFANSPDSAPTVVRVVNVQASSNSQVFVNIETVTGGTENGFGFTLNYDPNKLGNPVVQKGADTQTATLIPNTMQAGKIGVVLGMPFDESVSAGTRHLVTVRFNVLPNAPGGLTALTFSDAPVIKAVSDVSANTMQSTFQDGAINILSPTAGAVSLGGRVRSTEGKGIRNALVTVRFPNGEIRTTVTGTSGKYLFADIPAGDTYIVTVAAKHYAFSQATQIRQIIEDTLDVDFVADLPGLTSILSPR